MVVLTNLLMRPKEMGSRRAVEVSRREAGETGEIFLLLRLKG